MSTSLLVQKKFVLPQVYSRPRRIVCHVLGKGCGPDANPSKSASNATLCFKLKIGALALRSSSTPEIMRVLKSAFSSRLGVRLRFTGILAHHMGLVACFCWPETLFVESKSMGDEWKANDRATYRFFVIASCRGDRQATNVGHLVKRFGADRSCAFALLESLSRMLFSPALSFHASSHATTHARTHARHCCDWD